MKYILSLMIFLTSGFCYSQNLSPELISTSGNTHSNNIAVIDYSIGEIVVETFQDNAILTQGFHQDDIRITSINDYAKNDLINVYPNPTSRFLNIDFPKKINSRIQLLDINGKLIREDFIENKQTQSFDVSSLAQGSYFLNVLIDNNTSTYQIQKMK